MVSQFRIAAVAVIAAVCLTACGASDEDSSANYDRAPTMNPQGGQPGPPATAELADGAPGEQPASSQPVSTFAVDVDTASYGYAKRQLLSGQRPAAGTIRPEEFVNSFQQGYRQPSGDGFAVSADGTRLPRTHRNATDTARLLRVGLQTRAEPDGQRLDASLTFVVDVSGSMAEPGKLDLVKSGLHTLVDQLRTTDSVALIAYNDDAEVLRQMTAVRDRSALHNAIDRLRVSGSTNLEAGLRLGYETARKSFRSGSTNRVILLSDGLPNVGSTNATSLVREVQEAAAKQITMMGVGVGSDYGDKFMEELADKGDGYVVYVSDTAEANKVFVEQLPATLAVRALDAKAQVEFDPAAVASYRLIGYENRALSASAFRNDRVDGGEVGPGHAVTALYALHLRPGAEGHLADVRVRWQDPQSREPSEQNLSVTVASLNREFSSAAPQLQVCYTAAYFAEVLRASQYAEEVQLDDLLRLALRLGESDRQVAELSDVIRAATKIYR
ncbi:von Willebrand factor type A domain-containing protein [Dactylosporangium sp. NPDC050688]|uniref:vWA domain-containing protein n=1 Tax=Dactylosporangium sp. NPDC050688 TaxID=3157217 RepID=UPI0033F5125C